MADNRNFYFFIENEFVCRKDINLLDDENPEYSKNALTINLVNFSSNSDKKVYKIFYTFTPDKLQRSEMERLYGAVEEYIKVNFLTDVNNDIFIGCVRDDNETHRFYTEFDQRTDPVHDIFNILKNIYCLNNNDMHNDIWYNDGNVSARISNNDLVRFLNCLSTNNREFSNSLPIVEYYSVNNQNIDNRSRRVWIPNRNWAKIELIIEPLRYLFKINYYEKLNEVESNDIGNGQIYRNGKLLINLFLLLKKILNSLDVTINSDNHENYCEILEDLKKYSFIGGIRCLQSLKDTMQCNIDFFDNHEVPFQPIWFSTQMIEAEKGRLRYKALNGKPCETDCTDWFQDAIILGVSDEEAFSEFGTFHLKFDPLLSATGERIDPMEFIN